MTGWKQFEYKNAKKESRMFEDLCRKLFKKRFPEVSLWPAPNPNNPGIEMPPVYDPASGQMIGFQAKYISHATGNSDFYRELESAVDQTIHYYSVCSEHDNRPKITEFYFYSNRTVSTECAAYKRIYSKLNTAGIGLRLVCNETILDEADHDLILRSDYFCTDVDSLKIPRIPRKYISNFDKPQFENSKIPLSETYVYNTYSLQDGKIYDDLEKIIIHFCKGDLKKYLNKEEIIEDFSLLFVRGMQCTGKSTLIGKLIYDYYHMPDCSNKLHVFNFDDRDSRRKEVNINFLKETLHISDEDMEGSLIIIDGIDESDRSTAELHKDIEFLISDMESYGCRAIITCRNNLLDIRDLDKVFCIEMQQFSIPTAIRWIESNCFSVEEEEQYIKFVENMDEEYSTFILRPYILSLCIKKGILNTHTREIGQLYEEAFLSKQAVPYKIAYDNHQKIIGSEYAKMLKVITNVAMQCASSSDHSISAEELKQLAEKGNCDFEHLVTEFFLIDGKDTYYFTHYSLAEFFVSRYIFLESQKVIIANEINGSNKFLNRMAGKKLNISDTMIEFLTYFARKECRPEKWTQLLKFFLSNQFIAQIDSSINMETVKNYYYSVFIFVLKLVIAIIAAQKRPFHEINLFSNLTAAELQILSEYSSYGESKLDELCSIYISNVTINHFNFATCTLRGKKFTDLVSQMASFKASWISGSYFIHSDFSLSTFLDARCVNTIFKDCILNGCNFKHSRLNGAHFENTCLVNADLRGASVYKTHFSGCNLEGMKIDADQLKDLTEFDLPYILNNKIKVFRDDCELPALLLEDEMKRQRPVEYAIYKYSIQRRQR